MTKPAPTPISAIRDIIDRLVPSPSAPVEGNATNVEPSVTEDPGPGTSAEQGGAEQDGGLVSVKRERPLVFIADDDELLQQLVSHKLMQRGCETRCMENGEALLKAVEEVQPDLVVLDAMMPIMDGYEVLRRLRAAPATSAIPVIMLTARRGEQDVVTALSLGANDYLAKPFMPEELALRVRSQLDKAASS